MTPQSTPSGLTVREIKTKIEVVDGVERIVPELDAEGNEIELSRVSIPLAVEAAGGDAIDAHVLEQLTAPSAAPPIEPIVGEGDEA